MKKREVWKCQRVKADNKIRQKYFLITHTLPELESLLSHTKWVLFHVLTGNKSQSTMCWVHYVVTASLEVQNIPLITQTTTRRSKSVDVCGVWMWWEYQHKSQKYSCSARCYDWFFIDVLWNVSRILCPEWEDDVLFLPVRFLIDESIIDVRNHLCKVWPVYMYEYIQHECA